MADPDQSAASSAQGGEYPGSRSSLPPPAGQPTSERDNEIDFLDLLTACAKHKKFVLGFPLIAASVAFVVSFILPKWYDGITRILPPQQQQSTAASMLSQLGALASLAGVTGLNVKNPSDLYVGLLKSRSVADALIKRFDLMTLYDERSLIDARKELDWHTTIKVGKEGIITIEVEDKDPKRASDMANAYVNELNRLTQEVAVTEAAQRRVFFEHQLLQAKNDLTNAEVTARRGLVKGGITQVDAQGRSMIEVTARLRAQITGKEVQIGAMRTFAADNNPDLQRAQQELVALKRELTRVEGSSSTPAIDGGDESGNSGLNNLARIRDVKYYEYLYEFMAKQYEIARIDEAKEGNQVQVIDLAVEPDKRSRPKQRLITVVTFLVAGFLAVLVAFALDALERARSDLKQATRLRVFHQYLIR